MKLLLLFIVGFIASSVTYTAVKIFQFRNRLTEKEDKLLSRMSTEELVEELSERKDL